MPSDNEPSKNLFVRFKEHVDSRIGAGLHNVLNIPSVISESVVNSRQPSLQDPRMARDPHTIDGGFQSSDRDVPPDFRRWLNERRRAVAEDEHIGDVDRSIADYYPEDENVKDICRFERLVSYAETSRYSPLVLAEEMPRQPRPRDIESDMKPRMFTYIDAFEDLLAEASGRPMMDLRARYNLNKLLHIDMYPEGIEPRTWIRRLEVQGLDKAYFGDDRSPPATRTITRSGNEAAEDDRAVAKSNTWPSQDTDDTRHTRAEDQQRPVGEMGLFAEIEKVVKALTEVLDGPAASRYESEKKDERTREPHTENDLYDVVQSAFNDAQMSLGTFFKSLADGIEPRPRTGVVSDVDTPASQTVEDEDGTKIMKSTREYIDEYGNKHVRTEMRKTSKDGNVVSTESHYSVRPASEVEKAGLDDSQQHEGESGKEEWDVDNEHSDERKRAGWFWK